MAPKNAPIINSVHDQGWRCPGVSTLGDINLVQQTKVAMSLMQPQLNTRENNWQGFKLSQYYVQGGVDIVKGICLDGNWVWVNL